MTALLDGESTPGLGGIRHVLEGSYSGGGGHIVKWRGCILRVEGSIS